MAHKRGDLCGLQRLGKIFQDKWDLKGGLTLSSLLLLVEMLYEPHLVKWNFFSVLWCGCSSLIHNNFSRFYVLEDLCFPCMLKTLCDLSWLDIGFNLHVSSPSLFLFCSCTSVLAYFPSSQIIVHGPESSSWSWVSSWGTTVSVVSAILCAAVHATRWTGLA